MRTLKRTSFGLALAFAVLAAPLAARDGGSYGFIRVLEGSATVVQAGNDEPSGAEINLPVLAGDRLSVPSRSRLEIVLADFNLVRVDGGSELVLARLAESPDSDDRRTVLRLEQGNLQLVVVGNSRADLPQIDTPSALITVRRAGVYRVTADRDWTEVMVREGLAEVESEDDAALVRAQEGAWIDGGNGSRIAVETATSHDALERWASRLDEEAESDDPGYVDSDLRYASSSLSRHGTWITISSRPYWRPTVSAGWRPYWHGRWVYTPAGLTWVAYEPWGWIPYHYGTWDYFPGHGWLWEPGYVWSPAWVYWYWGPSHVGWCPTGYYTRYYGGRFGHGFRHGVYGWASGHWGFNHWTFVGSDYFRGYRQGHRDGFRDGRHARQWDVQRYAVPVDKLPHLGRGVITTDTRPLKPDTWTDSAVAIRALSDRPGKGPLEMPDVTPFLARKPALPDNVSRWVAAQDNQGLDGTPLKPSTLGRKPAAADASWHENTGRGRSWIEVGGNDRTTAGGAGRAGTAGKPQPVETDAPVSNTKPAVRPAPESGGGSRGTSGKTPVTDRWSLPRVEPSDRKPQESGSGRSESGSAPTTSRPRPDRETSKPAPQAPRYEPKPGGSGDAAPPSRPAPDRSYSKPAPAPSRPEPDRSYSKPAPAPSKPEPERSYKPAPSSKPEPERSYKPAPSSKPETSRGRSSESRPSERREAKPRPNPPEDGRR